MGTTADSGARPRVGPLRLMCHGLQILTQTFFLEGRAAAMTRIDKTNSISQSFHSLPWYSRDTG